MLNLMSPTKQAKPITTKIEKGDNGKEPKLHLDRMEKQKPWENPCSVKGQFSSGQSTNSV